MPLPAAAFAGAAAAKHLALHAVPYLDVATLSYAAITAWLLSYTWKNKVPDWAKEDVSFRNLLSSKKKKTSNESERTVNENDEPPEELSASDLEEKEMANLASILEKLQALVQSVQLDDDHPTLLQQHAALLAYIQLCAQIKQREQQHFQQQQLLLKQQQDEDDNSQNSILVENRIRIDNSILVDDSEYDDDEKKEDYDIQGEPWKSRDHLYESSGASFKSHPHIPANYHEFIENPKDSPMLLQLQQALQLAAWAYYDNPEILSDKLMHEDFCLLQHSLAPQRPGHVAYYVAVSSTSKKQLVIGVRGTSTVEDIVTDCCSKSVPFDDRPYYYDHDRGSKRNQANNEFLDPSRIEVTAATLPTVLHDQLEEELEEQHQQQPEEQTGVEIIDGDGERIWVEQHKAYRRLPSSSATTTAENDGTAGYLPFLHCHEGIMVSSKRLVDTIQEQVEHWVLKRGYQLVICGHSLGAGVAALAAVILRSRLPELTVPVKQQSEDDSTRSRMHIFCFAPPPVLDRDAALAACDYCTSIVNNADMIPRCSIENLLILLEIIKGIWKALQQQGLAPVNPKTTAAFFKLLAKGVDEEGQMLMSSPAVRKLMLDSLLRIQGDNEILQPSSKEDSETKSICSDSSEAGGTGAREEVMNHNLYVPGVVLLAYEPWNISVSKENPVDQNREEDCKEQTEPGSADMDNVPLDFAESSEMLWEVTDGTARALRYLDLDASSRMFVDHTTTSYYSILDLEYEF